MSTTTKQARTKSGDAEEREQPAPTAMGEQQIERVAQRATKFLATLSRNGRIRSILDQGGYTREEHQEGWSLLLALLGYAAATPPSADEPGAPASSAVAELDQWDGPSFARARAALEHKHPEQAAYVFANLAAKSGADSIAAVRTFLDRIAALRTGSDPARKATKAADRAAAELLAKRQILDAKIEAHLRRLIETAITLAPANKVAEPAPQDRQVIAHKLAAWLNDWRETARVLVTRRDYRIALGLAQRRAASGAVEVEVEEEEGEGEEEVPQAAAPSGVEAADVSV